MIEIIRNKRKLILKVFIFILIVVSIISLNAMGAEADTNTEISNVDKPETALISDNKTNGEYYKVDIKGAVVKPGVYQLSTDRRIIDAINEAGGLTETADTSTINLSKRIVDEMVIIIYTKDEINNYINKSTSTITSISEEISKTNNCLDSGINGACITNEATTIINSNEALDLIGYNDLPTESSKISINTASISDLDSLPGIGLTKAQAIIDYRNNNGMYTKIEDIMNVTGIGSSTFDQIKDLITI